MREEMTLGLKSRIHLRLVHLIISSGYVVRVVRDGVLAGATMPRNYGLQRRGGVLTCGKMGVMC